ncbi:LysR family transcriptional regulator [Amycolatopsis rhabdoformis]|uniref:LysR family transcriptional regulator n=1 Tax=Amycolatopsis rhabdoformis TaxID=1448059 RepID=A0ABZ1HWV2_9PSEU|nr:LysR family transcriptional regulator [Amycolatopsis rhabdoformis]WSE26692.1 LysR family transcriptional regulator [Amycolatopsis rhabdoformis]
MDLNLRLLKALEAVADEGSMTRAAGRLMMTQQAVSGQIRQLERVAGTPLVRRRSWGVELTAAGQVFLKQGRELLTATHAMVAEARLVGSGLSGRLRIAFKAQSTAHFLPDVETSLHRVAPDVEVVPLAVHTLPDELDALLAGTADAAFLWLPIGDDRRFVSHRLLDEPRWVALPPGHRLAHRTSLRVSDLVCEPIVGPRDGMPDAVVKFWFIDPRPDGSRAVYGPQGRTPEECLHHVAAGRGSWIAPASTAAYFPYPRLVWLPLEDAAPLGLALIWLRENSNPLLDLLLEESKRVTRPTPV